VLSAIAENPQRIKAFFKSHRENDEGVFIVNWYKNGLPMEVILDDHIPCKADGYYNQSRPCFSRSNNNALWVMILEKAWAKLHGGYVKIVSGLSHETFRDLTAGPASLY
jgi:hypothetical protein